MSDQVAAPLALAHVQAVTAEPVPLVETDHAHEASSPHEGQCLPLARHVHASTGLKPSGYRAISAHHALAAK